MYLYTKKLQYACHLSIIKSVSHSVIQSFSHGRVSLVAYHRQITCENKFHKSLLVVTSLHVRTIYTQKCLVVYISLVVTIEFGFFGHIFESNRDRYSSSFYTCYRAGMLTHKHPMFTLPPSKNWWYMTTRNPSASSRNGRGKEVSQVKRVNHKGFRVNRGKEVYSKQTHRH